MQKTYSWNWVQKQVAQTTEVWNGCAGMVPDRGPQYGVAEQQRREREYDRALAEVEGEAKRTPRTRAERLAAQDRITASFARFSAAALDLQGGAVELLTDEFLPVGTRLARWARQFDANLSMPDIVQACRNAWTACGLQPLLGEGIALTPSILGYSLLYPYTDNFLDRTDVSGAEKRRFSERFRVRLQGDAIAPQDGRETAMWDLVGLIEGQYPRGRFPGVFECLLAIHRAQEDSVKQLGTGEGWDDAELLRLSCAKGGTSVLADTCMARGEMSEAESRFGFEWGVLLQLGDDLQDVREDLQRGSVTLFSRAAVAGVPLDGLANQLLSFSERVAGRMDSLSGTSEFKELLRMSWRSLIVGAVGDSHQFFSAGFLEETERSSPFRFEFLRARRQRLASREGLYARLFDAFLEDPDEDDIAIPVPTPTFVAL